MTKDGRNVGAGTDFVMIHGGKQAGWVWTETIAAMRLQNPEFGRALALDVPGCGAKRGRDVADLGIDDVVAEFAAELDAAGVRRGVLVGHSQAGTVLPKLLIARPDMFRAVVYVSCCAPLPGQTVAQMMGGPRGDDPAEVGRLPGETYSPANFRAWFGNDMDDQVFAAFQAQWGKDNWPPRCGGAETDWPYRQSPQVDASYVVLTRDQALPPPWQARFADRLGAARTHGIDAGHQVMQTCPHALAELLLKEAARTR